MIARIQRSRDRLYIYFENADRTPKRKSVPAGQKATRDGYKHAEKRRQEMEAAYLAGQFNPWEDSWESACLGRGASLSLTDVLARFLAGRPHLRPKSRKAYRDAVSALAATLPPGAVLGSVTTSHVRSYVERPGVAKSTQAHAFRHLRAFFRWAAGTGLVTRNPMKDLKPPKVGRTDAAFLTEPEFAAFFAALHADAEARRSKGATGNVWWLTDLVEVGAWTGLRLGELRALRWGDVNEQTGQIAVRNREGFQTKNGHDRHVPVTPGAAAALARIRARLGGAPDPSAYVLTGAGGRALGESYASHAFKAAAKRHGLPDAIHFHSLRHTFISWAVMRGAGLHVAGAWAGHSDPGVTKRYAHLDPEHSRQVVTRVFGN